MSQREILTAEALICPGCGAQLEPEGELLRCVEHGLFFRYGPRLLVQAPRRAVADAPLLPWQTMQERATS